MFRGIPAVLLLCLPGILSAQDSLQVSDSTRVSLRLLLGCDAKPACDFDYVRTELPWLGYVRDRPDADVQVISTSLPTASGGVEVMLRFIGLGRFQGMDDEIRYSTPQGATLEIHRSEFVRVLKIGLTRYLARTPELARLSLTHQTGQSGNPRDTTPDPWDYFVYKASISGWASGESQSSSRQVSGSLTMSRVTHASKIRAGATGSDERSRYKLSDSSEFISRTRSYSARALVGWSIGPHFSAGLNSSVAASTRQNLDFRIRGGVMFEYDFFPYDQYSRRHLVLSYNPGITSYDYTDTTIYNKVKERVWDQNYGLWFSAAQSWGNAYLGVEGSSLLRDLSKNRISLYGGISMRIVKGLDLSVNGSYSRVRDQINLAKGGATDEEILLQIRELRTSYTYQAYVSLSYTWGSLLNNVVNPRLDGGGEIKP